jgi:hypothetical protein
LCQQSIEAIPVADGKKKKKASRFKRGKKAKGGEDEGTQVKIEVDEALCRGMVDVISQTNG